MIQLRIERFQNSTYVEATYTVQIWGITQLFFCLFNKKKDLIKWIKIYGLFMILIYFQLFLASDTARLLRAGFFPIIFLGVSGIKNILNR